MSVVQTQFAELRESQLDETDPETVRDHILSTVNPVIRGLGQALAGGINGQKQLDADVLTFKVTTPASDWTTIPLISPWVPFTAGAEGVFRKDQFGRVTMRGLVKGGADFGPIAAAGAIPSWAAPIGAVGAWRTIVTASRGGTLMACQLDVQDDGGITLFRVTAAGAGTFDYASLDASWVAAKADPEPPAGFPLTVIIRKGRVPYRVDVCQVLDSAAIPRGQTQRQHAIPYSNPSCPAWRYLGESGGQNRIAIDSIAGLSLGRTYTVTIQVWYST